MNVVKLRHNLFDWNVRLKIMNFLLLFLFRQKKNKNWQIRFESVGCDSIDSICKAKLYCNGLKLNNNNNNCLVIVQSTLFLHYRMFLIFIFRRQSVQQLRNNASLLVDCKNTDIYSCANSVWGVHKYCFHTFVRDLSSFHCHE